MRICLLCVSLLQLKYPECTVHVHVGEQCEKSLKHMCNMHTFGQCTGGEALGMAIAVAYGNSGVPCIVHVHALPKKCV